MRHVIFAVILVLAAATGAAADTREDADSAYQNGDYARAAQLSRSLAEQGDAAAQFHLGVLYAQGRGVPEDDQEALKWYRKAAEQGYAPAHYNLGWMYHQGQGVPQDYPAARKWYRKAAERGFAQAQFALGLMYDSGRSVPQDFIRAHMWYTVAAAALSGDAGKISMKNRDDVASKMTAAQIGKAQEMARRCQETKFKECD